MTALRAPAVLLAELQFDRERLRANNRRPADRSQLHRLHPEFFCGN